MKKIIAGMLMLGPSVGFAVYIGVQFGFKTGFHVWLTISPVLALYHIGAEMLMETRKN